MNVRRQQLRAAKQRQRARDREAGLMLYQAKLPAALAERLKAGLRDSGFRARLCTFLEAELLRVSDFSQLAALCWNLKVDFLMRTDAFAIYERNWRHVDQSSLGNRERQLLLDLADEFGGGLINA